MSGKIRPLLLRGLSQVFVGALAFGVAAAVCQIALYERLLVPQLPELARIPPLWIVALVVPFVVAAAGLGWVARTFGAVARFALGGSAALLAMQFVGAHAGWPGHLKSYAREDPAHFFTLQAMIVFAVALGAVSMGWVSGILIRRFHGGAMGAG